MRGPRGDGKGLLKCRLHELTHPVPGRARAGEHYADHYSCQSPYCPECEEKKRYTGPIRRNKLKIGLLQDLIEKETGERPEVITITLTPPKNQSVWWQLLGCAPLRGCKRKPADRARWHRLVDLAVAATHDGYVRYPSKKNPQGGAYTSLRREFAVAGKPYEDIRDTEHVIWNNAIKEMLQLARSSVRDAIRHELELDKQSTLAMVESYDPMSEFGIYHHVHVVLLCAYTDATGKWHTFDPSMMSTRLFGEAWKRQATRAIVGPLETRGLIEHVATCKSPSKLHLSRENQESPVSFVPLWRGDHAHVRVSSSMEGAVNYALKSPLTAFYQRVRDGRIQLPPDKKAKDSRIGMALFAYHRLIALSKPRPRMITSSGHLSPRKFSQSVRELAEKHYPGAINEHDDWMTVLGSIIDLEESAWLEWWMEKKGGSSSSGSPTGNDDEVKELTGDHVFIEWSGEDA